MDLKQIYWAAGFLEGEGCFTKAGSHNNSPEINAVQVQVEPLVTLHDILGGKVTGPFKKTNPKHNSFYKWRVGGSRAAGIIMTLYPILSEKRQKAIAGMLKAWKQQPNGSRNWAELGRCRKGHPFTGENHAFDKNTGKYRCRQCSIEYKRKYYATHADQWRIYYGKKTAAT